MAIIRIDLPIDTDEFIKSILDELSIEELREHILTIEEDLGDYDFTESLTYRFLDILSESDPEGIESLKLRAAVEAFIETDEPKEEDYETTT